MNELETTIRAIVKEEVAAQLAAAKQSRQPRRLGQVSEMVLDITRDKKMRINEIGDAILAKTGEEDSTQFRAALRNSVYNLKKKGLVAHLKTVAGRKYKATLPGVSDTTGDTTTI